MAICGLNRSWVPYRSPLDTSIFIPLADTLQIVGAALFRGRGHSKTQRYIVFSS